MLKPIVKDRDVAAAGTAERLLATASKEYAHSIFIEAKAANVGNVFVGDSTVTGITDGVTLTPSQGISYEVQDKPSDQIDISEIFVDAANNDDGVIFTYLKKV